MRTFLNILLLPFSLTYGVILYLRNKCYDWKLFESNKFNFPIISVGNLTAGGTGKTPHVEYLVRLLENQFKIAILSRGYRRSTTGFFMANNNSTVNDIGDESLQYKLKFKDTIVAVDEKRVNGIKKIKEISPETSVILLDDAYQHRSVYPGINILITDCNNLYTKDFILPSGRLREWPSGSKRANIIIVSKTAPNLSSQEQTKIKTELRPLTHQKIYFSFIKYGSIVDFTPPATDMSLEQIETSSVLLLTGIANPQPLLEKIKAAYNSVEHLSFSDHHNFSKTDINTIQSRYKNLSGNNKIIITTEKDIMRLSLPKRLNELQDIPIFYIPIEICFHGNGKEEFDKQILKYVAENSRN